VAVMLLSFIQGMHGSSLAWNAICPDRFYGISHSLQIEPW